MSYKTILVHVDQSPHAAARIALAVRIASEQRAHLVGAAMTGISRFLFHGANLDLARTLIEPQRAQLVAQCREALARFEAAAGEVDGLSFEQRLVEDDAASGLALQARYADLAVLGQTDPGDPASRATPDLPAYVMLDSACPVLVAPYAGASPGIGNHALVGWDDSVQASRAVRGALPLLRCARKVSLVLFNPPPGPGQPGADIALYLARHGVNVEVMRQQTGQDVGNALLSLAAERGADLLVMGGYGHARFREVLLGGVTQTILASMTIPVLMSH